MCTTYLVGYSGGLDSTVLLHLLYRLRQTVDFCLVALHVDHGIASKSAQWAFHCARNCESLGVDFRTTKLNLSHMNSGRVSEAEARTHRYAWFSQQLQAGEYLLTAHHQNDQAETVLLNLMRGAGVRGLAGIQPKQEFSSGWLLRPLLDVSQAEIREYAKVWNLPYIEDSANMDLQYDRNYLRHVIIPAFSERWPTASRQISQTAEHLGQSRQMLAALAQQDTEFCQSAGSGFLSIGTQLCVENLKSLDDARQINLLRHWTRQWLQSEPNRQALNEFITTVIKKDKEFAELAWSNYRLYRYQNKFYLTLAAGAGESPQPLAWNLQSSLKLKEKGFVLSTHCVTGYGLNPSKLSDEITVRFRRGSERIRLPNRQHATSLKKLFQQHFIPPWERDQLPLIYCQNELIAVVPWLISDEFKVGEGEDGISISLDRL